MIGNACVGIYFIAGQHNIIDISAMNICWLHGQRFIGQYVVKSEPVINASR